MLQKISISNECCLFKLSIHERILKNKNFIKKMSSETKLKQNEKSLQWKSMENP